MTFPRVSLPVFDFSVAESFTKDDVQHTIDGVGAVIFRCAMTADDVEECKKLFWDWIEGTAEGKENGVSCIHHDTIFGKWWDSLCFDRSGVFTGGSVQQSRLMWYGRTLPNVRRAFEHVWGYPEEQMLCSFDGCGAFREPVVQSPFSVWGYRLPPFIHRDAVTKESWIHSDQHGPERTFQGVLNVYPTNDTTGGTVIVPGSHHTFSKWNHLLCERRDGRGSKEHDDCYAQLEKQGILVDLKAGDLLIWDSRVAHCNTCVRGLDSSSYSGDILRRLALYITMEPKSQADNRTRTRALRAKAIREGFGGGHRPTALGYRGSGPDRQYKTWWTAEEINDLVTRYA